MLEWIKIPTFSVMMLDVTAYIVSCYTYVFEYVSSNFDQILSLVAPAAVVLCVEVLVDSLKHAFITKFNQIKVG